MVGLRLAYPNDRHRARFIQLLIDAGLAYEGRGQILSTGEIPLDRIVGVSSNDLPVLLLDGVFDVVLTTTDRLVECEAGEEVRSSPRPFGRVVNVGVPNSAAHLVWGFSEEAVGSEAVDAQNEIFEMARGGLEFSPGRAFPRTVMCATTHPALAGRFFRELEISADVRYYPDPWSVVAGSSSYCGLGLVGDREKAIAGVRFALENPVLPEAGILVMNQVACASRSKRPLLDRLETVLNRFISAQEFVEVECWGDSDVILVVLREYGVSRRVRVFQGNTASGAVQVSAIVEERVSHRLMDALHGSGAERVLSRRLHSADLRD